jgi:hypothetical protein
VHELAEADIAFKAAKVALLNKEAASAVMKAKVASFCG